MVKRREPKTLRQEPTDEQIDAFAAGADNAPLKGKEIAPAKTIEQPATLDKNAKRDFKAISVPFNEYEYSKLEKACEKTGRSKLNLIRHAILTLAEQK